MVSAASLRRGGLRRALALGLVAAVSLAACGGSDDEGDADTGAGGAQTAPPPAAPAAGSDTGEREAQGGTRIRIGFGDTELGGTLDDSATARDLAAQLPLTLTFRDHNGVEKTAPLPSELSVDGAPESHDPAGGDIGYWAPDGDLVFYYDDDAPAFAGIVRIGRVDGDIGALARQSGDVRITVERVE